MMANSCYRLSMVGVSALLLAVTGARAQTVIVEWHFPDDTADAVADGGIAANTNRVITAEGPSGTVGFTQSGATTRSAHVNGWTDGAGTNHWRISFSSLNFTNLTLSSKQRSTSTGPRDFQLQYRSGEGDWLDVPDGAIQCDEGWTTGVLDSIPLPAETEDRELVEIRWLMASNTSVGGEAVQGLGRSNIDDIVIRGTRLPPPAPRVLKATGVSDTGFTARWEPVDEADAYVLDVAVTADFTPGLLDLDAALLIDFEDDSKTGYAAATVTLSQTEWDLTDVLIGTHANDWKSGAKSARFRGYGTSAMTLLDDLPDGLGLVHFLYRRYGTDAQVDWRVEYSTDGGGAWAQIGEDFTASATDEVQVFSNRLAVVGDVRIRIIRATETGTADRRLNIDDIVLAPYDPGDFVAGYEGRDVGDATAAPVGGLTKGWHYYRVRAVVHGVAGDWSAVMPVWVSDTPAGFMMFLR